MTNRTLFKRFSIALTICSLANFYSGQAQDSTNTIGRVSIASPTAASLGKYGDIPVSYHTGLPNIDIPIYTVKSGSLKLPIGLSYHASGLKVMEPAGWVGAGWTLNAGGAITRTVVGAPDDRGYSSSNVLYGHYTDFGFETYITNSNLQSDSLDDYYIAHGIKDGEPDLYFFNFGGYSGKFYYNDDRTPILVPEQDFRIQTFFQTGQGFTGFIITTPDGTSYYFGQVGNSGSINPIETTNPFTLQSGPSNTTAAASSWFLNKIVSADGVDSITLSYQQENYSYYTLSTFPVLNTNYNQLSADYTLQNGMNVVKNLVQGVRLSQVNFANGTVTFTPAASPRTDLSYSYGVLSNANSMNDAANTNSYPLGSISVSDNYGFCKKDSFYFGYFYDNTPLPSNFYQGYSPYNIHSDEYRLRLDSIRETSCDGSAKVPPYKFNYFTEKVPRRMGFGQDHWGYANGADGNSTMVPTFTVITNGTPQTTNGGNRDAGWPAMRGGALQQITYPTGGYTLFDFEPKNVYTFTNSIYESVPISSWVVHEYGQGNISQTLSFTTSGSGPCPLTINNTSTNWSPTFTITNSSNTVVYNSGLINFSSSISTSVSLSAGTYTATLSFPSNAQTTLINGADAQINQWQYVPNTTSLTVGGLRIKTITHNDGLSANNIVTSYNYNGGGSQSTGVLYSIPVYVQVLRNDNIQLVWGELPGSQAYCSPNGCFSCDGFNAHNYYISPGSVMPMNSLQGENMGYNEVDVSQSGNGRSVYRYYGSNLWGVNLTDVCQRSINQSSVCDGSLPSFPYAPLPFEFMRDELQYEGHFAQSGQLLREKYYFPSYTTDRLITPGHSGIAIPGLWNTFTEYVRQSAFKAKDSVVTNYYDPSSGVMLTTRDAVYYNSIYHHQPTHKVTSMSTGDSLITNTKYALDFRISSCDASVPDSLSYYLNAFHADSVWLFSNINSCSPQVNNSNNCRWATFGQFRMKLSQDRTNFISYRRRSFAPDAPNLLSTCYLSALPSADTLLKPILRLQNMYENVPIEISEWKDLNLRHASFTRYDTSLSPVGFAYPGHTQLINLQTPSATFTNASISGSTIAKDSRYADETVYKFSTGNPLQLTGRDGVPISYIWDYSNKEPIAKASNATVDQIAYTSFEADGNGTWTIPSGTRDATAAITGAKSYNLGNGACSRSGLTSANTYVVSYWSKTGSAYIVTGSISTKQGKTITIGSAAWTYFEHTVTGTTSVSVSGSGDVDELRLYPSTAQMTTYTYSPLVGISSQCDVDNRISYYTYDGIGRLFVVKDQDGNILKTVQYHYQGQ
jgi:hypothetical protein